MEHYRTADVSIRRAVLRQDGFVSLQAAYSGGTAVTQPLRFSGSRLAVNYATSAAGSVRVEIQDVSGEPLEGFRLADCPAIYGDELERTVSWQAGPDLARLAGATVRLRFELKDADLYSFQFR